MKIKKCPFCGDQTIKMMRESLRESLRCTNCGASGPYVYEPVNDDADFTDAINKWNDRKD